MFAFGTSRPRRAPSLTAMIDVVFLLLVFFMLASRFGTETHVPLLAAAPAGSAPYSGPPRLVDILPDGVRLNGQAVQPDDLAARLSALTGAPGDTIVLRARDGASLQRLVDVVGPLRAAGFTGLALVE